MQELIPGKMYRIIPKDILKNMIGIKEYIGMYIESSYVNDFFISHIFCIATFRKENFHPFNWTFELLE